MRSPLPYQEIWAIDFEFYAPSGERPQPICLVARELLTGRLLRVLRDELMKTRIPPYTLGKDSLAVAYYSSSEWGCHLALGWPMPVNVIDLFCEFSNVTNGRASPFGRGLVGALRYFGLGSMDAHEKESMRNLAMRPGPWTLDEQNALLEYCESDVLALERLMERMAPHLDLERALLRGRYMVAAARIEWNGIPIDTAALSELTSCWGDIQDLLIERIAGDTGIYEGRTFKYNNFESFLAERQISWPRLDSGRLDLSDDTFKDMARSHPDIIGPIRELQNTLSKMRSADLAVGKDGRNRVLLSAFRSKTSRNQPSNAKFIFGPSTWLRSLIRPEPGRGLAYVDFSQQEFGIGAALSKDQQMQSAYLSGDRYLEFGRQCGMIPPNGTKDSHSMQRGLCKAVILGIQYGMGEKSLAHRIQRSEAEARELLRLHRETYKVFWQWSDSVVDYANLHGRLWTVFGWYCRYDGDVNPRSARNFPMQANGAEILRLACILCTEAGIRVCAPVHDALLVEFPLDSAEEVIAQTQYLMEHASEIVLDGFRIRTDVKRVDYPDRYTDERGATMWDTVWEIIRERQTVAA